VTEPPSAVSTGAAVTKSPIKVTSSENKQNNIDVVFRLFIFLQEEKKVK
jgi:hypothetical protein